MNKCQLGKVVVIEQIKLGLEDGVSKNAGGYQSSDGLFDYLCEADKAMLMDILNTFIEGENNGEDGTLKQVVKGHDGDEIKVSVKWKVKYALFPVMSR